MKIDLRVTTLKLLNSEGTSTPFGGELMNPNVKKRLQKDLHASERKVSEAATAKCVENVFPFKFLMKTLKTLKEIN